MRLPLAAFLLLSACGSTAATPTDSGADASAADVGCTADVTGACPCPTGYANISICSNGQLSCGCGMLPADSGVDVQGIDTDGIPDSGPGDVGVDVALMRDDGVDVPAADVCVMGGLDRSNCGTCGNACVGPQVCASNGPDAGVSCQTCPTSTPYPCGNTCVNLGSDPMNCGDCDVRCPAWHACIERTCA